MENTGDMWGNYRREQHFFCIRVGPWMKIPRVILCGDPNSARFGPSDSACDQATLVNRLLELVNARIRWLLECRSRVIHDSLPILFRVGCHLIERRIALLRSFLSDPYTERYAHSCSLYCCRMLDPCCCRCRRS